MKPTIKTVIPSILWQGPKGLLKRQSGFFRTVKPDPTNLFFNIWEQEKVAWGQIWTVGGMRYQLDTIFGQEVQCLDCGMCQSVVMVKKQVSDARLWAAQTPSFEGLGKTMVDVPIGIHCATILERNYGNWTYLTEKAATIFFPTL